MKITGTKEEQEKLNLFTKVSVEMELVDKVEFLSKESKELVNTARSKFQETFIDYLAGVNTFIQALLDKEGITDESIIGKKPVQEPMPTIEDYPTYKFKGNPWTNNTCDCKGCVVTHAIVNHEPIDKIVIGIADLLLIGNSVANAAEAGDMAKEDAFMVMNVLQDSNPYKDMVAQQEREDKDDITLNA